MGRVAAFAILLMAFLPHNGVWPAPNTSSVFSCGVGAVLHFCLECRPPVTVQVKVFGVGQAS